MGNRLSKAVQGGSTVTYSYDSVNRLVSATGMGFTCDDNDNLLTWDDGVDDWTYRYDPEDRLINVKKNGDLSAVYTYDADGRRARSLNGDNVTDHVYSGLNVIDEVSGGAHKKHYYAGGIHIASNDGGTIEYYHQDHLGSTRLKTDGAGSVIYESNYEPYGPGSGETGSEEYRYTGKRVDPTGLYYYGARYYDPATGRFTTRDTVMGDLADPQSLNGYSYCRNNPHKYTDPDGRLGMLAAWAIGTGAYTVLHVLSSLKKYEQNRNPLMTKEYHNWERNRVIVKETTRGMIRGGLTIAAFVATKSYDVPNPKTATASTYVVADIIAGPASAGVGMVYDTITDGPCSAETHNYEILEEAVTPIFTATDQIKERVIDPVLDKNPSLKIAVDELYDDIKSSMTYWVLGSITDTSYDYIERKRGA